MPEETDETRCNHDVLFPGEERMTKYRVYYCTIKEYQMDVEAEDEKSALKEAKEYWSDGDEMSEWFDDEASTEVEVIHDE